MSITLACAGLRHGHIFSLLSHAETNPDTEVVAICEEDATARKAIVEAGRAEITHTSIDQMLAEVECDAIAVGDYFSKRGSIVIRALEAGKHVISDKPLCTGIEEWKRIQKLSTEKKLKIGCMFTMRDSAQTIGVRNLLQNDEIGEVHAISFGGQHPLMLGSRAAWYFEPGKHGGTINDIRNVSKDDELSTPLVLRATRNTLMIQQAADEGQTNVVYNTWTDEQNGNIPNQEQFSPL